MAKKQRQKLSDGIRAAVTATGQSRAAIGRALGISEAMMSRFMSGKGGLSQERLDALADYLGLVVTVTNRGKAQAPAAKPGKAR